MKNVFKMPSAKWRTFCARDMSWYLLHRLFKFGNTHYIVFPLSQWVRGWNFLWMITSQKYKMLSWWCNQMETYSGFLALCAGIHRSLVNSNHKGQWRRALIFSLICVWTNDWINNRDAGDLIYLNPIFFRLFDVLIFVMVSTVNFMNTTRTCPPAVIVKYFIVVNYHVVKSLQLS